MAHRSHRYFRFRPLGRGGRAFALAGGLALVSLSGALAQAYRGSPEDQQACTDDVFRLCGQFVPDEQRIIACLKGNQNNLSPACKAVFLRYAPPPPASRKKKRRHT